MSDTTPLQRAHWGKDYSRPEETGNSDRASVSDSLPEGRADGRDRCDDLTRKPNGYFRCILPLGHTAEPGRPAALHQIDFKDGTWLLTRAAPVVAVPGAGEESC